METGGQNTDPLRAAMLGVEDWFLREIFPLEGLLMHFLRLN
jgi:hypothetical protein